MQKINWYLLVFDTNKLIGNKKQIRNNGIKKPPSKMMEIDGNVKECTETGADLFIILTFELV